MNTRTVIFAAHAESDVEDLLDGIGKQHDVSEPLVHPEMTYVEFNTMMRDGLSVAKADHSSAASEVFADLRRELCI